MKRQNERLIESKLDDSNERMHRHKTLVSMYGRTKERYEIEKEYMSEDDRLEVERHLIRMAEYISK